jgi:hypothetical protein
MQRREVFDSYERGLQASPTHAGICAGGEEKSSSLPRPFVRSNTLHDQHSLRIERSSLSETSALRDGWGTRPTTRRVPSRRSPIDLASSPHRRSYPGVFHSMMWSLI